MLIPGLLMAQGNNDYSILLKSGKFVPDQNIGSVTKTSPVLQKSLFHGKHYVTIQFHSLPDNAMKNNLAAAGIQLIDYIPNYAFTASVSDDLSLSQFKSFPFRSVFMFSAEQKTVSQVLSGDIPAHAIKRTGYADLTIITYEQIAGTLIQPVLNSMDAIILEEMPMFRTFTIRIALENIKNMVDAPFVQWVEPIDPPNEQENLLGRSLHRVNVLNDGFRNLKGDGINIGIWDSGEISPHLDFLPTSRLNQIEFNSPSQHSTHVSGTILGRGLINPIARGMAPNATLYSYNFNGNIATEMANAISAYNLNVSSHSYGGSVSSCNINGAQIQYTTTSRNTDLNLNNFPFHLHCHSSGNSQSSCAGGWYTITGSGKTAKNNILVANITTSESLSSSSSCGPTQDGRIKPDISAFGTSVYSTSTPLNAYATLSGTSMSTPGISGSVSLLVQRFKELNSNNLPPSSLIKNTVLNTAQDLGNPGPDYRFGYGRINALEAVKILEEGRYSVSNMSTGGTQDMIINVPAGTAKLRVMLIWNDPAGAANANPSLVNNLDLTVINGAITTLPWILDKNNPGNVATRGVDTWSNVEQVTIDNPPAGNYTLRVSGTAIPVGPQEYSLTWSVEQPKLEVTYPNGGESFNPGTNETITWNSAGVTSTQTVEYSLNNGASWTTISSSVPATTTRLIWSVPAGVNTSQALIRVTSGTLNDVSNVNFKILGTPTGFNTSASCISGAIDFLWSAVANATHYDIYVLNSATGQWITLASDIAATNYTATGLTPGASMWFTIVAKNNTTASISERAYAINRTVSSGGSATIGNITGENQICGVANNIAYSVPPVAGATNYTWTVPPGAIISSGQGTSTIFVNFPAGSSSGDVTVYATAGSCLSSIVTYAVTVGMEVLAPVSGGDQTQNICSSDPIPTLTATVSVPPGHSVVWYDASTGGNVVATPILNSSGTITYYAASRNNTDGCESSGRTAVTLTINQSPAPAITANGATTFCEGGNVTLTANAGSAYSWSNGATTQAITVAASGSYSVTVTQPGGCVETSTAVPVTVNTSPPVDITPNGATTFCEGDNVILTATAGSSYVWSNGATTQSITVTSSGSFTVTVTQATGCSRTSAATTVTVNPKPIVNLSAAPYTKLFPGLNTTLTATATPSTGLSYSWTRNGTTVSGATTNMLQVKFSELGNYAVTATHISGCSATSSLLSISDSATTRLFIYPNPNTGEFQVSYYNGSGTSTTYIMTIYNSIGALVWKRSYTINNPYELIDVDLRKNGKGVYRVVISDRNGKKLATGGVVIQ